MGKSEGKARFRMVKERHQHSFENALGEGKVDAQLQKLCGYIAKTKDYFTSSGCAGRILLLGLVSGGKRDAYFHRKWHRSVKVGEVKEALEEESKGEIWFKQEAFILHIGSKDFKGAKKILEVMRKSGVKRGGIIVGKEGKLIVELIGTENMSLPVKKDDMILVGDDYLKYLVGEANRKLQRNYENLKKFEENLKKAIK